MAKYTKVGVNDIANYLKQSKGFEKILEKVKILTAADGKCTAELNISEEHTNAIGGLHGGLSATLVDCISSYALLTHENGQCPHVSLDIHMTYAKSANIGEDIVIDAQTLKAGKSIAFLDVVIKNKVTNELLVKGSHTKFLLNK